MAVIYEWDVETVTSNDSDEHEAGEVLDHQHVSTYSEAIDVALSDAPCGCHHEIVLVRDDDDCRAWAYVNSGKLPEYFSNADGKDWSKVPKKFHAEVARA